MFQVTYSPRSKLLTPQFPSYPALPQNQTSTTTTLAARLPQQPRPRNDREWSTHVPAHGLHVHGFQARVPANFNFHVHAFPIKIKISISMCTRFRSNYAIRIQLLLVHALLAKLWSVLPQYIKTVKSWIESLRLQLGFG